MFLTTWDDTGDVGIVNLTKAELKELTIGISSDKGENITRFQNIHRFHWYRKKIVRNQTRNTNGNGPPIIQIVIEV